MPTDFLSGPNTSAPDGVESIMTTAVAGLAAASGNGAAVIAASARTTTAAGVAVSTRTAASEADAATPGAWRCLNHATANAPPPRPSSSATTSTIGHILRGGRDT